MLFYYEVAIKLTKIVRRYKSYMEGFNVHLKPKQHITTHYPMRMVKLGPVRRI